MAELVEQAYDMAGVMRGTVNGQPNSMTLASGVLIHNVNSVSNVSINQIPMVMISILVMIFGLLPASLLGRIVASVETFRHSASKAAEVMDFYVKSLFVTIQPRAPHYMFLLHG